MVDPVSSVLLARKTIARIVASVCVVVVVVLLLLPRQWTASGSFVPTGRAAESLGGLPGIASQFGIQLSGSSGGYAPRFFEQLLRSETVLASIAATSFPLAGDASKDSVPLWQALHADEETEARAVERTVETLRRDVLTVQFDTRSGVTSFAVRTRSPLLSTALAHGLLGEVAAYLGERHQSRAASERQFVEARLAASTMELRAAEDRVQAFLRANRTYLQSPELMLEHERLTRTVTVATQNVLQLNQAFEQARIEEVRDTPVISIVDAPRMPARPESRRLGERLFIALFLSIGVMVAVVLTRALVFPTPRAVQEPAPLRARLVQETIADLLRPWRLLF